ncbi:MAG: hypothetical protein HOP10_16625 [Chitinophagaceae bacterium]|nr:hypothetical protein [Chitinophagaceae bacterium]
MPYCAFVFPAKTRVFILKTEKRTPVSNETEIVIKPCSHTNLAAAYGVSRKVLYTSLRPYEKQIGKPSGRKYSLEQLCIIFDRVGFLPNPIR